MSIKSIKNFIFFFIVLSQTAWAGESDIMFAPDSSQEITVNGDTSVNSETKDAAFVASGDGAVHAFNTVQKMVEGSFSGVISARFTDLETGESEELEFYGLSVDGSVSLIAKRNDGTLLVWTEKSLGIL